MSLASNPDNQKVFLTKLPEKDPSKSAHEIYKSHIKLDTVTGVSNQVIHDIDLLSTYSEKSLVVILSDRDRLKLGRYLLLNFIGALDKPELLEEAIYVAGINVSMPASPGVATFSVCEFALTGDPSIETSEEEYPKDRIHPSPALIDAMNEAWIQTIPDSIDWQAFETPLTAGGFDRDDIITAIFSPSINDNPDNIRRSWRRANDILKMAYEEGKGAKNLRAYNLTNYLFLLAVASSQSLWKTAPATQQCVVNEFRINMAKLYGLTTTFKLGLLVSHIWIDNCFSILNENSPLIKSLLVAYYFVRQLADCPKVPLYVANKKKIQAILNPALLIRAGGHGLGIFKNLEIISKHSSKDILFILSTLSFRLYETQVTTVMEMLCQCTRGYIFDQLVHHSDTPWFGDKSRKHLIAVLAGHEVERAWGWAIGRVLDDSTMGFLRPDFMPLLYVTTCYLTKMCNSTSSIQDSVHFKRFNSAYERSAVAIAKAWFEKHVSGGAMEIPKLMDPELEADIRDLQKGVIDQQRLYDANPERYVNSIMKKSTSARQTARRVNIFDEEDNETPDLFESNVASRKRNYTSDQAQNQQYRRITTIPQQQNQEEDDGMTYDPYNPNPAIERILKDQLPIETNESRSEVVEMTDVEQDQFDEENNEEDQDEDNEDTTSVIDKNENPVDFDQYFSGNTE